ncbi:hypothetical protein BD779DRAFT_1668672 [Infundibulicybe gibba]|nr:hypothetical protein BD779DRAFT_1668672 [Infundibulicybe gibba]
MASQRNPPVQTQPRTYTVTLKSLLALPFRICNPPPAVGKVRSFGVTPLFNVRLEDVLERKHLPPLGLKDFEEWLLYVEMCPENLYFILWLNDYTCKYEQWAAHSKTQQYNSRDYRTSWNVHNSSQLAMFYARAKQTFFTPNSEYELDLPSNILAPFHMSHGSSHPDPAVFAEVEIETRRLLEKSLRRFVSAQFNNVGNNRVLCGIIAGLFLCLTGSVPPLIVNFTRGESRWLRLTALPGLWLGLTILLAALNGICVGVYIFGDLRQLRKFELSRPSISKPQPLSCPRQRPAISSPMPGPPPQPVRVPVPLPPPPPSSPTPLAAIYTHDSHSLYRASSISSCSSIESSSTFSGSSYNPGDAIIHISPAYYDPDPVDGPATSPVTPDPVFMFPAKPIGIAEACESGAGTFTTTATFIHPFDLSDEDDEFERSKRLPEERQHISPFDFDSLPPRRPHCSNAPTPTQKHPRVHEDVLIIEPESQAPLAQNPLSITAFLERIQSRCNVRGWMVRSTDAEMGNLPGGEEPAAPVGHKRLRKIVSYRKRFKLVKAVPSFGVPLTKVLNPIVVRGQWEIVVRSAIISFFVSWVIIGSLLAVPVVR